jgi:hypothetical protein
MQTLKVGFAFFDFAAGKLPLARHVQRQRAPSAEQPATVIKDGCTGHNGGESGFGHRQSMTVA